MSEAIGGPAVDPNMSAVNIEVTAAESLVSGWRAMYDPGAAHGVPAHVTITFPFVPAHDLTDAVLDALAEIAANHSAFTFALTDVREFPGVLWLLPEPEQPFRHLTRAVLDAFPAFPPFGGLFPDPQPHLTIGRLLPAELHRDLRTELQRCLAPELPILCRADALNVMTSDSLGQWSQLARLPFAHSSS